MNFLFAWSPDPFDAILAIQRFRRALYVLSVAGVDSEWVAVDVLNN